MSKLSKTASVYFISNIASAAVPFLMLPILTRYLGPSGYGIVAMFTTFVTLLNPLIGLNTYSGLSRRWYDREEYSIPEYVSSCIYVLFISAIILTGFVSLFDVWIAEQFSIPTFWLYCAILISICLFIIQTKLTLLQVQEKPTYYGSIQFTLTTLNALLSYLMLVFFIRTFEGRLWGYAFAVFICAVWSFYSLFKSGFISKKIKPIYIKDALSFGAPLIPHMIGAYCLLIADRLIVGMKLGDSSVGIYMVAVQIALGFNLICEAFNKAFLPKLFELLKQGGIQHKLSIVKYTYLCFSILLLVPILFNFISKYIVLIIAGSEFIEAVPILNWLVLAQAFHGMYYLVTNYMFYENRSYLTSLITISVGAFSLVFTWFLVDKIGLIGAGIGAAVGLFFQFIITWLVAAKVHPMPWLTFWGVRQEPNRI